MSETPEEKSRRIQRVLQEAVLSNYPNPERIGCPGRAALEQLARMPDRIEALETADWEHVTHCSPCYAEYLQIIEPIRR